MNDEEPRHYLIMQGVHRSVAALQCGLRVIPALLEVDDLPSIWMLLPLEELYSPKESIHRFDRGRDFQALMILLGTTVGRNQMQPIRVTLLSSRRASYFTKLGDVQVL